jgi:phytoene synthase
MTLASARAVLAEKSKSFALAGRLLSARYRDDAAVLYSWCRRADDAIDECGTIQAPERLLELRAELEVVYGGFCPQDATLAAFQALVRKHGIPIEHPRALLDGFEMDLGTVRFETIDELLLYAYRVAGVVGLMMCPLLGVRDRTALRHATDLGIAMQLTNICRDVQEDWDRRRLYLPAEILALVGLGDLGVHLGRQLPAQAHEGLCFAVRRVLELADDYYLSGDRGIRFLPARTAFAIRTARNVYSAIGTGLRRRQCDSLQGRVVVPRYEKIRLVMQALVEELAARLATGFERALLWPQRAYRAHPMPSIAYSEELFHAAVGVRT